MPQTPQTYKNHVRWFPPFHFFVMPILLLNFLNTVRHLWVMPSLSTALGTLVAAALVMLALSSRVMPVTVQDRVIRLEMRLRLREVLPPELWSRINDLTPRQLVALRFASNAELPELARRVLEEKVSDRRAIKQMIKTWRPDSARA